MELKVEKLVTTEKIDGTTEEKAILKGESGTERYTLVVTDPETFTSFGVGDPYALTLKPVQTKLGETDHA